MGSIQMDNPILQRINNCRTSEKVVLLINNVELSINKYFAIAISQKCYTKYLSDNTIAKIDANADVESYNTYNVLREILQYQKAKVEFDDVVMKDLFHIGIELEIKELIDLYKTQVIDKMELDKNNCLQLLEFYFDISPRYPHYCSKLLECCDFISNHFFEIDQNKLKSISKKIGFDILQKIVINDKLLIHDEDSLANFVLSLIEVSEIFSPLIENVHFEFCSESIVNKLIDLSDEINYKNIIISLHDSLLRSRSQNQKLSRYNFITKLAEYKKSNDGKKAFEILDEISKKGFQTMTTAAFAEIVDQNKSIFGNMILREASSKGNLPLVKTLISNDFDKESKDKNGNTSLTIASSNGHLDLVKYLISIGADKEAKNQDGDTPLIRASYNGHLDIVKYLISIGADKDAKDNNGWNSLDCALQNVGMR
ncbi:hypothetical protein TVAG_112720 [Trichomonas vaginalis G3]|uniref:Uncharacterized protein n=1 Tax=Trichomonas vaginalis (strain ATCC PRA-98 / G3) TaxID=412133 RepID=A2G5A3_TRIV3|nr:spectrin binding [Trichomonas vaginalis G3]EAX87668.1 hypothetical protein TVAG_112720 [Trichomonas vaginalis G3]KAI5518800.1 spectrin binding [Trichomonas vaginalis G3]|eukprot:XP_001300598.1 hypothetical protein [Trichomonas vaginalis G3]